MLVLVLFVSVAVLYVCYTRKLAKLSKQNDRKNVAVIIAHPDDESMFFAPAITAMRERGQTIHLLCLSNGNFDGLGQVRSKELFQRQTLRIDPLRIECADNPRLQDGPKNHWPSSVVAERVERFVQRWRIEELVTFDDYGVSGHPNHIAVQVCKNKRKKGEREREREGARGRK